MHVRAPRLAGDGGHRRQRLRACSLGGERESWVAGRVLVWINLVQNSSLGCSVLGSRHGGRTLAWLFVLRLGARSLFGRCVFRLGFDVVAKPAL